MSAPKTELEFKELARKCELGIATDAELKKFDEYYQFMLNRHQEWDNNLMGEEEAVKKNIFDKLKNDIKNYEKPKRILRIYKYAATIAILFSIGLIYKYEFSKNENEDIAEVQSAEKKSNHNKAYLTLANGTKISLTDASNGHILQEAGLSVSKTKDGQVVYRITDLSANAEHPTTNTISTPAGGKYMVVLPDNSKIWLNTASSITFPTAFAKSERNVMVTGEVYLEVSKDPSRPFKVKTGKAEISVLGTHFNIMGYDDEPNTKITLIEGSVRVNLGESSQVIEPGQQALFNSNSNKIEVKNVDIDDVTGWKDGYFQFDNTPIDQVMREIKRWYDIDVVYIGRKPNISITAMISREKKISKILDLIKQSGGLDFEINDKQIIVKKIKGGKLMEK